MTDEKFVFNQDVRERSKMKTGAMHKKNGCKSKKCTLPSDYLSTKEKKKLNGPVSSISMNKPYYDWRSFTSLNPEVQAEYLNGLITNYGARAKDLAEMFGIGYSTFWKKMHDQNLSVKLDTKHIKRTKKMDDRWLDFITNPEFANLPKKKEKPMPKKSDEEILKERFGIEFKEEKVKEETKVANKQAFEGVTKLNIAMTASKEAILNVIASSLGDDSEYIASLDFRKIETLPKGLEAQYTT